MNLMELNKPAEKTAQLVYMLNGIPFLPHYFDRGCYVGPGYPRKNNRLYAGEELLAMGATPRTMQLWAREYV